MQWMFQNVDTHSVNFVTRIRRDLPYVNLFFSDEFRISSFNCAKEVTVFDKVYFWKLAKFNQSFFNRKFCLWLHPVVYFYKIKITDFGFSNRFHAVNIQFELVHWTISSRLVPSWTNQSQNWKRCEIPMSKIFPK